MRMTIKFYLERATKVEYNAGTAAIAIEPSPKSTKKSCVMGIHFDDFR